MNLKNKKAKDPAINKFLINFRELNRGRKEVGVGVLLLSCGKNRVNTVD